MKRWLVVRPPLVFAYQQFFLSCCFWSRRIWFLPGKHKSWRNLHDDRPLSLSLWCEANKRQIQSKNFARALYYCTKKISRRKKGRKEATWTTSSSSFSFRRRPPPQPSPLQPQQPPPQQWPITCKNGIIKVKVCIGGGSSSSSCFSSSSSLHPRRQGGRECDACWYDFDTCLLWRDSAPGGTRQTGRERERITIKFTSSSLSSLLLSLLWLFQRLAYL